MEINMEKFKVMIVYTRSKLYLYYKNLQLEKLKSYKYLCIDFYNDYS